MKISNKIQHATKEDRVWWSFEYFPPRTAQVSQVALRKPLFTHCRLGSATPPRSYRAYAFVGTRVHRHYLVSQSLAFLMGYALLTDRLIVRNAGGRTSDLTSEMVKTCQGLIGIETCMHLTCTNMPAEKVDIALKVSQFCYT